jgi:hypothetical protein
MSAIQFNDLMMIRRSLSLSWPMIKLVRCQVNTGTTEVDANPLRTASRTPNGMIGDSSRSRSYRRRQTESFWGAITMHDHEPSIPVTHHVTGPKQGTKKKSEREENDRSEYIELNRWYHAPTPEMYQAPSLPIDQCALDTCPL